MTTRILLSLLACAALTGLLSGCNKDAPPSLFDPTFVSGTPGTISNIQPSTGALGGVTILTISGQNFNTDPEKNLVFFDGVFAPVLHAAATQLQVKAPVLAKDSVLVKVGVFGSTLFSAPYYCKLEPATLDKFGNLAPSDEVVSMDCDVAGNVYASMLGSGSGVGVWAFTPGGDKGATVYSKILNSSVDQWSGMKFGSGGALFAVAKRAAIFRIPPGGGDPKIWLTGRGLTALVDLDFDINGNMWAAGSGTSIFRIKPDSTVQAFPFVASVRAVRVFNNYLYVGGKRDSLEKVWRLPISGGLLGAEEEYCNLSARYGANAFGVFGLAFNADGELLVGTDAADGILIVHVDKSMEPYYAGLLKSKTNYLTWGQGPTLFQARGGTVNPKTIVAINTQKTSAPYFGRTLP